MDVSESIGWTVLLLIFLWFLWGLAQAFSHNSCTPFHGYPQSPPGTLGFRNKKGEEVMQMQKLK